MMNGACDSMAPREEAHGLLGVIDVIGADGVFAIGVLEELRGGDDHRADGLSETVSTCGWGYSGHKRIFADDAVELAASDDGATRAQKRPSWGRPE